MAERIDGKGIAKAVRGEVKTGVEALKAETGITPGLATVLVGEDPASAIYVRNKHRACQRAGIESFHHGLPADTSQAALLELIDTLNRDAKVHGILVQLPLPDHLDELAVLDALDPDKDVDGFLPMSAGRLMTGRKGFLPCTPAGCMRLLDEVGVDLKGKRALVIGRSNIVGKPMALLLLGRHATVTIAHSRTEDLPGLCREADVVVAAVGRPEMVRGDWIKEGAVVIDVGMNRLEDRLCGDVHYEEAAEKASYITPVPGGVGPMTIAMLLANTLEAARNAAAGDA